MNNQLDSQENEMNGKQAAPEELMTQENEQQPAPEQIDAPEQKETPQEELDELEDESLEGAHRKGSLLFRLWAEAHAAKRQRKNPPKATDICAELDTAATAPPVPENPLIPERDRMSPSGNYLHQLRLGDAYMPQGRYEVLHTAPPPKKRSSTPEQAGEAPSTAESADDASAVPEDEASLPPVEGVPASPPAPPEPPEIIGYSSFIYGGTIPNTDQQRCFTALQSEAHKRLDTSVVTNSDDEPPRMDALCRVFVSQDQNTAHALVFPPHNGGADVTAGMIEIALDEAGVAHGIQQDVIEAIAEHKEYLQLFTAAIGTPCINGKDGQIIDHFNRTRQIKLIERDDHTVDYKDLNWVQRVHEGEVICDLIPPVPPQDGCTVLGRTIPGRQGRQLIAPAGKNTQLSEDGTQLLAMADGQITFTSQRFSVEPLLVIQSDVGRETGNIEALGNIVVKGNVMEGFSVTATGDINIGGMVEGATICAGGNVQVGLGMNGNMRGTITAGGTLAAKYLENCTVTAGSVVHADNIINCTILCDDRVVVTSGRGIIIGGSITALNGIEATVIGNHTSRATSLVLGSTPGSLARKADIERQLKNMYLAQSELEKNLKYLERESQSFSRYQQMLTESKVKLSALKVKLSIVEKEYKDMVEQQIEMSGCQICCRALYPPTQITFGAAAIMVRELIERTRVYYHEGEIHFGSLS